MAVDHVWIFDDDPEGSAVGVWVSPNLLSQPDPPGILRMAVIERQTTAKRSGTTPEALGFGMNVYGLVAEQKWRRIDNQRTEVASGNAFAGGAFLMFGETLAPHEVEAPETAYEVRQASGTYGLIQLRPVTKKKTGWWRG